MEPVDYDKLPHVIATGNPAEGFELHGPFPNKLEAIHHANTDGDLPDDNWWIMPVFPAVVKERPVAIDTFEFDTQAEAFAFIKGVEYVNDSAITVVPAPQPQKQDGPELLESGKWRVTLDYSDIGESGQCRLCGEDGLYMEGLCHHCWDEGTAG